MAQKKKKEKHIKKLQQRTRKTTREKMTATQIIIILFTLAMVFTLMFGTLAQAF